MSHSSGKQENCTSLGRIWRLADALIGKPWSLAGNIIGKLPFLQPSLHSGPTIYWEQHFLKLVSMWEWMWWISPSWGEISGLRSKVGSNSYFLTISLVANINYYNIKTALWILQWKIRNLCLPIFVSRLPPVNVILLNHCILFTFL